MIEEFIEIVHKIKLHIIEDSNNIESSSYADVIYMLTNHINIMKIYHNDKKTLQYNSLK